MNISPKIAAVIVTYNRKSLLMTCIQAIENQTFKPLKIYIIDNASTDGTEEEVTNHKFSIAYEYIKLKANIGGAGGFYTGIKAAFESKSYDGIWVMDDDGVPDKDCLKYLIKDIKFGFVAPLVLNIENHDEIAFPYLKEKTHKEILASYSTSGKIINYANPFNGILFSKELIEKVGYPKKDMFIWGDEDEYQKRALSRGFKPITVISALHYHPKDRLTYYSDFLGRENIIYVESELRRYCKYRNKSYSIKKYGSLKSYISYIFAYSYFYLISRKLDFNGLKLFLRACYDGRKENFKRHSQYLR